MIDPVLARSMMEYAAGLLGYPCPDDLPEIRVEADLECLGQIRWSWLRGPVIALRNWREGNVFDQAVLIHELVHHVQRCNDVDMSARDGVSPTEIAAVTVECRWLLKHGANPADHLSYRQIFEMTGDADFASLSWLKEAA